MYLLEGNLIRYGEPERWKKTAEKIGRTKPSRAPDSTTRKRKKNDGRPPDTKKELFKSSLSSSKSKKKVEFSDVESGKTSRVGHPSYHWQDNSCWLDTSLKLLFTALTWNFDEFMNLVPNLDQSTEHGLQYIAEGFVERRGLGTSPANGIVTKSLQGFRNGLCKALKAEKVVNDLTSMNALWASFSNILSSFI